MAVPKFALPGVIALAFALTACQGLEEFSRSVDEAAASIIPDSDTGSARADEADRKYRLGLKYMDGDGIPQSYAKAAELFSDAAADGVPDAQFMLGLLHRNGQGVARDDALATRWFRRAAEREHAEAQFFLGAAYRHGRGVSRDESEAVQWFTKAAAAGHTGAQYELGVSYATARGVTRNDRTALRWFEKAAALGHPEAQYFAGQSYANGRGAPIDHAWAARWYGKAAGQGLAQAQYMLGVAYAAGLGLPRDPVAGYMWLSLAAKQNDAEAIRLRDALARRMNRSEIEQAAARAQSWRAAASTRFADPPTVRFAQVALAALGFDPGPVDGQMGERTSQAIAAYQAKAGLRTDGTLTQALVDRVRADRADALAKSAR